MGIDVAIPCYNYGHFLRDCVGSLLAQRVSGLRVLIIDNASSDDSLQVAQQLAAENPAIEVVAHRHNLGPHASFNEAIDWARQRYFLLLCADDLCAPGALARAVSVLERHPEAVLSHGRAALLYPGEQLPPGPENGQGENGQGEDWRILAGEDLLERFCGSAVCHLPGCTAVVRTEVQKRVGYYRPALPHTDDFEMWMRFACQGAVAETSAIQGGIRAHASSQSAFVRQQHRWDLLHCEAAFESFFAQEGGDLAEARRLRRLARRSIGGRAYWSAMAHLGRGDLAEALVLFGLAMRRVPSCALVPPFSYLLRREDAQIRLARAFAELGIGRRRTAATLQAEG